MRKNTRKAAKRKKRGKQKKRGKRKKQGLEGQGLSGTGDSQRDSRESIRANRFAIEPPFL